MPPARSPDQRPTASSPLQTQERLLAEALELMTTQGVAAMTLRQLARRMNFTVAAVYYHFPAKDDLLAAVLSPYLDRVQQIINTTPIAGAADHVLSAMLDLALSDPARTRLATLDLAVRTHPTLGAQIQQDNTALRELLGAADTIPGSHLLASAALGVVTRPVLNIDNIERTTARIHLLSAARRVLDSHQARPSR